VLIPSHRHTAADLALWAEYEEADYLTPMPSQLPRIARKLIQDCPADYISTSWGKDSVVMMHLAATAKTALPPAVWVRMVGQNGSSRDNPDCELVRDAFLRQFPKIVYHERTFVYENCPKNQHWRAIAKEFGPRRMIGIRAGESGTRSMSLRHLGANTKNTLRPIGYWKTRHVFGWLAKKSLPIHPAYAMLGGGRYLRGHLRTHGIGGSTGDNRGRREWEREYYPDICAEIQRREQT